MVRDDCSNMLGQDPLVFGVDRLWLEQPRSTLLNSPQMNFQRGKLYFVFQMAFRPYE
jgi:hypothetical protein